MSQKNLLADTDYTSGKDMRFKSAVWIGKVSKIECTEKRANVRVLMPDRVDHEGTPLNSKPIPILQIASKAKKSFAIPRLGDNVAIMKLANATSDYVVVGSFYTSNDPPPVTDPLLDYCEWEGGHIEKRDANQDAAVFLLQDFKGGWKATIKKDIDIKTTDTGKISIVGEKDVLLKSAGGNVNVESPSGTITLKQQSIVLDAATILLKGAITIQGNITMTGAFNQTGFHVDSKGPHASTREYEERIAALEARVATLEAAVKMNSPSPES